MILHALLTMLTRRGSQVPTAVRASTLADPEIRRIKTRLQAHIAAAAEQIQITMHQSEHLLRQLQTFHTLSEQAFVGITGQQVACFEEANAVCTSQSSKRVDSWSALFRQLPDTKLELFLLNQADAEMCKN